jgi:hypothetical protein
MICLHVHHASMNLFGGNCYKQRLHSVRILHPLASLIFPPQLRRKTPQTLPFSGSNRGLIRPKLFGISGPILVVAGSTPAASTIYKLLI